MVVKRLLKFGTVGASGAVISLSTLYILTDIAGWHYLLSYIPAFILAVSSNYYWNSRWTFNDRQANIKGYLKYASVSLLSLGIREAFLYLFTDVFNIWYMASAVLVIGITTLLNFVLSRRYVWNAQKA